MYNTHLFLFHGGDFPLTSIILNLFIKFVFNLFLCLKANFPSSKLYPVLNHTFLNCLLSNVSYTIGYYMIIVGTIPLMLDKMDPQ